MREADEEVYRVIEALMDKPDSDGDCIKAACLIFNLHSSVLSKDLLLRQALHVINHCIPRNEDNADKLADKIKQELSQ